MRFSLNSGLRSTPVRAHRAAISPLRAFPVTAFQPLQDNASLPTTAPPGVQLLAKGGATRGHASATSRPTQLFNVVFVSSEAAPFSRTGGLAEVMGALPDALAQRGHRCMVVSPRYASVIDAWGGAMSDTGVRLSLQGEAVGLYYLHKNGVDHIFVDHPSFHRPGGLYGDKSGPYPDNLDRFKLLSLAALEAPLHVAIDGQAYGEGVVFVANDWHAALVPVFLSALYRPSGLYGAARVVLALHNLAHQGVFGPEAFQSLSLPPHWYPTLEWIYRDPKKPGAPQHKAINLIKAAIETSDRVVTVSPSYAEEIRTPGGGMGLESMLLLRRMRSDGVLNGVGGEWAPGTDPHLPINYTANNFLRGKAMCKEALQIEVGLPVSPAPLVAFVGRLDAQKGADVVRQCGAWLAAQGAQLVLLGTGSEELEGGARELEANHPEQFRCIIGFDVPLSHRIIAGADLLLMPSRFEPCGLAQMYAMRYGTPPVVTATGGLKDSVVPFNPWKQEGCGWVMPDCTAEALKFALGCALQTYTEHPKDFHGIQWRGMVSDFSWTRSAVRYEEIFSWAKIDPPHFIRPS